MNREVEILYNSKGEPVYMEEVVDIWKAMAIASMAVLSALGFFWFKKK